MPVEVSELQLIWPAELFAAEARTLLAAGCDGEEDLGFLLAEAFDRDRGFLLLREVVDAERRRGSWDPWSDPTNGLRAAPAPSAARELVAGLADRAGQLPLYRPRQYYSARLNPPRERVLTVAELRVEFADTVGELALAGYFDESFGSSCCDSDDNPDGKGQHELAAATGHSLPMWPLRRHGHTRGLEEHWSEEQFYDVVEALHDLVARPRRRWWHDYCREWDHADFVRASGQAVYRWLVNSLLTRSQVPLRLAEEGDERGFLVTHLTDGRNELMQRATAVQHDTGDEVHHAIALWRRRGATQQDKRSAIFALGRVLEARRQLIKTDLLTKDENALFEIGNRFDLRHRNASQQDDYDPVFLDWVFWWYLATVELTDRLVERQAGR